VNNDCVARSPIVPVCQCLQKIRDMWEFFGRVGPNTAIDTEEIVARRAAFYGTLFACTGIPPKKEEYKLSELRTSFEVHLRYACMEQNGVFEAVLRMCIDYDSGLTCYSGSGNPTSRPKMTISWLRPLKALSDADLRIIAQKCSTASGRQLWYFADFTVIAKQRK
jgi:hypothetical protein